MTLRERLALWIYPVLRDELSALRSANTKAILRSQCLLNEREDFIVSKGLWSEFTSTLSRPTRGAV